MVEFIKVLSNMKEVRIYIVSVSDWDCYRDEFDFKGDLATLTDDDFMTVAECIGDVYTLQGFQDDWNDGIAPMNDYSIMRIFEVDVPSE